MELIPYLFIVATIAEPMTAAIWCLTGAALGFWLGLRRGRKFTRVKYWPLLAVLLFLLPGCALTLLKSAMDKNDNLSPEQIEAYNKVGLDVYACFEAGGPPPSGNLVFMLWPKTKDPKVSFGPNCQIVRGQEGGGVVLIMPPAK